MATLPPDTMLSPTDPAAQPTGQRLARDAFAVVMLTTIATWLLDAVFTHLALPLHERPALSAYFAPAFVAFTAFSVITSGLLMALVAWSVLYSWLERHARMPVAPRVTLAVLALLCAALYGASRQLAWAWQAHLPHWVVRSSVPSLPPQVVISLYLLLGAGVIALVQAASAALAAGLALAASLWRGTRPLPSPPSLSLDAARRIALLCGWFACAIATKFQLASVQALYELHQQHPWAIAGDVLGPMLAFGLVWRGARWGVGQPVEYRPLRALAVCVTTLGTQTSLFLALTFAGVGVLVLQSDGRAPANAAVITLVIALILLWLALSVVLTAWMSAIFYRRSQRAS